MKETGSADITAMTGRLFRWPPGVYMPCIIPSLWVWVEPWHITPEIRLLINWLWVSQKGDYYGWAWPNQVSLSKESQFPAGLLASGYVVNCRGAACRSWGPPPQQLNSANSQWAWKRTLSLRWHAAPANMLIAAWWCLKQRIQLTSDQTFDP